jgi:citrate lyase subunit beta/citryl-CoA lyase
VPATPHPVNCLIESAPGLEAAVRDRLEAWRRGISLGESDLRSETGALEAGLDWARGRIVNAAVAAGLPRPPQSVYPHVRDQAGLARSCARGRELGHLGRAAIHPDQLPVIEQAYLPTDDEVARAQGHRRAAGAARRDARHGACRRRGMLGAARQIVGCRRTERHNDHHRGGTMKTGSYALAGCAALLVVLLAPSAVGSSAAVAEGSLTEPASSRRR